MGEPVTLRRTLVLMMNKPAGVLSASRDSRAKTVVDSAAAGAVPQRAVPGGAARQGHRGPADSDGRRRSGSPDALAQKAMYKLYEAELDKPVGEEDVRLFAQGLRAGELECLPAQLFPGEDPGVARAHPGGQVSPGQADVSRGGQGSDPFETSFHRKPVAGSSLKPGEARLLSEEEQAKIFEPEGKKGV